LNHKNVPLYVESKGGSGDYSTIVVQADNSATGTLSVKGYIQACRNTLYKCKVAHTILSTDSIDDLVKPTNISYWDFGDICGKRLSSCSKRFAHVANKGSVDIVHIKTLTGVLGTGVLQQGSGYTSVPTVGFSGGGGSGASATAVLGTTSGLTDKVVKFTGIVGGSGYTSNPTVTISGGGSSDQAVAEAQIKHQTTDNVALPFGGFPGASFG
jgi:hypothetical protein